MGQDECCHLSLKWWFGSSLGGGFKVFCIFIPIWGRFPIWLIFFHQLRDNQRRPCPNKQGAKTCPSEASAMDLSSKAWRQTTWRCRRASHWCGSTSPVAQGRDRTDEAGGSIIRATHGQEEHGPQGYSWCIGCFPSAEKPICEEVDAEEVGSIGGSIGNIIRGTHRQEEHGPQNIPVTSFKKLAIHCLTNRSQSLAAWDVAFWPSLFDLWRLEFYLCFTWSLWLRRSRGRDRSDSFAAG